MRLTVVGSGPAAPQPDTPASGLLVEVGDTRILLDCGLGVMGALRRLVDPTTLTAVVIGHMHADHYLDLAGLRYLFPWGERAPRRLPVFLPPGGRHRLTALASAISERAGFFDDAFLVDEYADGELVTLGTVSVTFARSSHYVPAWSVVLDAAAGGRIVYVGDTGPNPRIAQVGAGAGLLVCEATLDDAAEDTPDRGHLSLAEAVEIGRATGVPRLLVTHYPSERRAKMAAELSGRHGAPRIDLAVPGLTIDVPQVPARNGHGPLPDRDGRDATRAVGEVVAPFSAADGSRNGQSSNGQHAGARPPTDGQSGSAAEPGLPATSSREP